MSRQSMRRNYLLIPLVFAALAGCQDSVTPSMTGPSENLKPRFSAFPGTNGKIAFTNGLGGIGTINPDGSGRVMITTDGWSPAWSADGTKIAFSSNSHGDNNIYVMNANGSGRLQLTSHPANDDNASWSPDGTKIAFSSDRDGQSRIYVMNSDGTGASALTNRIGDGDDNVPSWSPDGAKIAFTSGRGTGFPQIYVMDADGSNQTALTASTSWEHAPRWSPDGSRIAFQHQEVLNAAPDVYVMDADGSNVTNLTASPTIGEWTPTWSPDGTKVAYLSYAGGNGAIYVRAANGSGGDAAIPNSSAAVYLDWQPEPVGPVCVFGPTIYTREKGRPLHETAQISAAPGSYIVDLDELGSSGADAVVRLNGVVIMEGRGTTGEVGPRHLTVPVYLTANNALEVELRGKKGSVLQVKICSSGSQCYPNLPAPVLELQGTVVENGYATFELDVPNYAQFPDALFAQAPDLAACGLNTSASRTYVDIFDGAGNRLFGFCSLGAAADMNGIYFATPVAQYPAEAYIVIHDRRCNISYTSNRINLALIF